MAINNLSQEDLSKLKSYLSKSVLKNLKAQGQGLASPALINQLLDQAFAHTQLQLDQEQRERIFAQVTEELMPIENTADFGPIQVLLDEPLVTEIMVNGPYKVYAERGGKLQPTDIGFRDNEHVLELIQSIVQPLGRRIDSQHPAVDARLPDGSRVNAVIPPAAIDGPTLTIRKFAKDRLGIQDLIQFGSLTETMSQFLEACVRSHLNIIISGGTGSGKTTLLNILSSFIPDTERIVTIEDAAELQLQQDHVVRLETTPTSPEGEGMSVRALLRNSLRMRPDRIVVGEVRGGEALDMLQAMNTGHDGSLTTLHANTPRDAISRLETMVMMAGMDLPVLTARQQIASAVDLIVQQSRLSDGSRIVTHITEVSGMEGDTVVMTDIFHYEQTGTDAEGKVLGQLNPTGIRPLLMGRLQAAGFKLNANIFMQRDGGDSFPNQAARRR